MSRAPAINLDVRETMCTRLNVSKCLSIYFNILGYSTKTGTATESPQDTWHACVAAEDYYAWFVDMLTYEIAVQQSLASLFARVREVLAKKAGIDQKAADAAIEYGRDALDLLARGHTPATPPPGKRKGSPLPNSLSKRQKTSEPRPNQETSEQQNTTTQEDELTQDEVDMLASSINLYDVQAIQHLHACIVDEFSHALKELKKASDLDSVLADTLIQTPSPLQDELRSTRQMTIDNCMQGLEEVEFQLHYILSYVEERAVELLAFLEVNNSTVTTALITLARIDTLDHVLRTNIFWDIAKNGKIQHWLNGLRTATDVLEYETGKR